MRVVFSVFALGMAGGIRAIFEIANRLRNRLFLFTSYVEGFGLPPLEAMACGAPVVMTDALGNRDYAVNGVNSIVVRPGDVKALVDAAYQVLTDEKLRERLRQVGLETARKWSWDRVVDVFERAI